MSGHSGPLFQNLRALYEAGEEFLCALPIRSQAFQLDEQPSPVPIGLELIISMDSFSDFMRC